MRKHPANKIAVDKRIKPRPEIVKRTIAGFDFFKRWANIFLFENTNS